MECAVCGSKTEYTIITSTSSFGSPDLDTRPPKMQRSTIFAWVQRCPKCGYCAKDVSKATPQAKLVVSSPEYANQLTDSKYPDLANSFLCKALIDEKSENYAGAAWSLIHAAWVCDDAERNISAKTCRNNATDMIRRALENGQKISDQNGAETALQVDLLRRAGNLSKARELIQTKQPTITGDIILKILAFQEDLIANDDQACHTISEALRQNNSAKNRLQRTSKTPVNKKKIKRK